MTTLISKYFNLNCDPEQGTFDLIDNSNGVGILQGARMLVSYRQAGQKRNLLCDDWHVIQQSITNEQNPQHGPLQTLQFVIDNGVNQPSITVTFALPERFPLVLTKVSITNQTSDPIEIERIELLRAGGQSHQGKFQVGSTKSPDYSFYSNGWQSWSYTGIYTPKMAMRSSGLGLLVDPVIFNPGTPKIHQTGYFTADFFGAICDRSSRTGLLAGFLAQRQNFGTIEAVLYDRPSLRLWANGDNARLDPGMQIETDWAILCPFSLDDPDPLGEYVRAVAREHNIMVSSDIPAGWCSWYHYYAKITPAYVRSNLAALIRLSDTLPLDRLQIDDGFEAEVGDWFDFKPAFVDEVAPLAREINAAGLQPGLWLAPFIVHPRAKLVDQHPDWLLRDARGRAVNTGFGWNALTRGLDLTVPEALDYVRKVISTAVHDWGYPYLKLDFLYAAAVKGRYQDSTRTRAQVLRMGMKVVREAAGADTFILGCGAPLGSTLGLVDAMRIGEDVSGDWRPNPYGLGMILKDEFCVPSVRNAVHNTLTRSPLHSRWWINDPDCLLVRPDTNLTLAEVQSLASVIAMTGGALLVSDDLSALPENRRRIIEVLLPLIGARPEVPDLFDSPAPCRLRLDLDGLSGPWHLCAFLNWAETPTQWRFNHSDYRLEPSDYLIRSFWDGKIHDTSSMGPFELNIPAHGVSVLAVRKKQSGNSQYLGSDLHISQGIEISQWTQTRKSLDIELTLPRRTSGNIYLSLPHLPKNIISDDTLLAWTEPSPGIVQIPVAFVRKTAITVKF